MTPHPLELESDAGLGWFFVLTSASFVAALALDAAYRHLQDARLPGNQPRSRPDRAPADDAPARTSDLLGSGGHGLSGERSAALVYAYAVEALVTHPGSLPGGLVAAWLDNWWWLPGLALPLSALLLLMPDGRLASRRWWPVPAAVVVGTALGSSRSRLLRPSISRAPRDREPARSHRRPAVVVAGHRRRDSRRRRPRRIARRLRRALPQLRAATSGSSCAGSARRSASPCRSFVVGALLWGVVPGAEVLPALAFLALPAGIAVAVLKYRLYDLDLVVNRAARLRRADRLRRRSYVAVVGLVGASLSPGGDLVALARRDRRRRGLLPATARARAALRQPADVRRARRSLHRDRRARPDACELAAARRRAPRRRRDARPDARIAVRRRSRSRRRRLAEAGAVAEYGTPGAGSLVFPLVHQGSPIGELRLTPRPGERLRERDHRLIADLAPQVAAAVHAVGLSQELPAGAAAHRRAARGGAPAHPARPARRPRACTRRADVHARGRPQPDRLGPRARRRACSSPPPSRCRR